MPAWNRDYQCVLRKMSQEGRASTKGINVRKVWQRSSEPRETRGLSGEAAPFQALGFDSELLPSVPGQSLQSEMSCGKEEMNFCLVSKQGIEARVKEGWLPSQAEGGFLKGAKGMPGFLKAQTPERRR